MIGKFVRKTALSALLLLSVGCVLPAWASPTPSQLVEAVTNSKVLPASVRVNAQYSMGQVSIYMYRSGRVSDNDLKIDSVLITKVLKDKFGSDVKQVQLNFYDSGNQRDVRQCVVSQAQVEDFAARKIGQDELLKYLAITRTQASSGSSGSSYTNAGLQQVLSATCAPGFKEGDRHIMLIHIQELAKRGGNFQRLFALYKQMDDMIRSGQAEEIVPIYNQMGPILTAEQAAVNQKSAESAADAALKNREAMVKAQMLSYFPRYGFAYQRRVAIWSAIKRLAASGRDVTYQASYLFEHVDNPFYAGKLEEAKAGIIQLEKVLGLPVTYDW